MPDALEMAFVGSLLLRSDAVFDVPASFNPDAFREPISRRAFDAIGRLARNKRSLDVPLVAAEAGLREGEIVYLRDCLECGTAGAANDYAIRLQDRHRRSTLRGLLAKASDALTGTTDSGEIVSGLLTQLLGVDRPEAPETVSLREAALATIDHLDREKVAKGAVLPTGYVALDQLVKIRRGNLIVLAAQAGVGKSTLALNIAENVARRGGKVLVHSLEMDDVELVGRILSRNTGIQAEAFFDDSDLGQDGWARVVRETEKASTFPLHLNTTQFEIGAICRITEREHRKGSLSLVVVDYLQLVEANLGKNATDEARIGTVSRTLKMLAQRLKVPVLAVAQLNREIDRRAKEGEIPAPRLSDLRGSGRIEQDANTVMFLHNPHAHSADPIEKAHGPFEVTVMKQRLGRRGTVLLRAMLHNSQFVEVAS